MTTDQRDPNSYGPHGMKEFSARRLTVARQHRSLTKKALAEQIGVTSQAITSYEDGTHAPSPEKARCIARVLDCEIGFFYADDVEEIRLDAISFRSRRSLTARVRDKTKSCGEIAADIVSPELLRRFRLPTVDIPEYRNERPEAAASFARAHWQLGQGPITNMVHLLEAKGVGLYWFDEESPFVDAVSLWRDDRPFVLASLRSRGGERLRFDVAHELGHLVLHKHRDELDSREVENEADRFASAFLLPDPQFRFECSLFPTLEQYLELKKRWKVSVQAMIRRSRDMGLITTWQYHSLFKTLSARWGRMREPNPLPFEESAIQPQMFELLTAKGIYADDFAMTLWLKVRDLEELIPCASRYRRPTNGYVLDRYLTIEELGYPSSE